MAPSNQDSYMLQEPKTRLHSGITGPKMAAETPDREPEHSDHKDPAVGNVDNYSGLEVVETGLEVVPPCPLPEALPQHQQTQYAEYKPWPQYSPSQPPPPHPGYPQLEGTPISPPYGGGMVQDYQYHGGHNPFEPPGRGNGRICGLRRVVFWAVLAIGVFAIVAAVAIGLGVGLGTRSSSRCVVFPLPPLPARFIFTLCPRGSSCPARNERSQ